MSAIPHRILGDKYRLVRPLDKGGMGSVWLAEHLSLASPVAVKLIASEAKMTEHRLERFVREARSAAASRSPHVVQVLDYGVDEGTPYIVMELLVGESLAERLLRVGRLPPREVELIIRHVSRAIARAHEMGIVHRDLKPQNIFITRNDDEEVVKLFDFGIAKATPQDPDAPQAKHTRTGSFLGTPFYMSPEQLEGKRCDSRTDIWALGVIAFECLLGRLPFIGGGIGGLVLGVCSDPLPVPSAYGPVPAGFDDWFARACARNLDERFASAREASRALRRSLDPSAAVFASIDETADTDGFGGEPLAPVATGTGAAPPDAPGNLGFEAPPEAPRSGLLPSTTAAPSSATVDRGPAKPPRSKPLLLLIPIAGCLTLLLALRGPRLGPAGTDAIPPPAAAPAAVVPVIEPPPETSGIQVLGSPEQTLSLDGTPIGPLPRELQGLAPGEHSLTISAGPRYRAHEARVTLAPGQVASLGPVALPVDKGLATIVLGDGAKGAEVRLKVGKSEMRLPPLPVQLDVEAGEAYVLLARKKGKLRFEQPLSFEDGQAEKTFTVTLTEPSRAKAGSKRRAGATRHGRGRSTASARAEQRAAAEEAPTLTLMSIPDSVVLLDGMPLGNTPLLEVPVASGSHRVIFIHGEQRKAMVVVGVPGQNRLVKAQFDAPPAAPATPGTRVEQ